MANELTYKQVATIFHCERYPERIPAALDRHKINKQPDGLVTREMLVALWQCEGSIAAAGSSSLGQVQRA